MSIDKTSSVSSGLPTSGIGESQSSADVTPKQGQSAFDRVTERHGHHEDASDKEEGRALKAEGKDSKRKAGKDDIEIPIQDVSVFQNLRSRSMERTAPTQAAPTIDKAATKKIIDEVVQTVRVGVNQVGDKEMQFDLKTNVLDGASVRVSLHDGKVVAVLQVSTLDTKQQLEACLGELRQNMENKGLAVSNVQIEYKEPPRDRQQQQQSSQQQQRQRQQQQQQNDDDAQN